MSQPLEALKPAEIRIIPREESERGRIRVEYGYGALDEDHYARMLRNQIGSRRPPTLYAFDFEGGCSVITPQDQITIRLSTARDERKFIGKTAFTLFDAAKVVKEFQETD